MQLNFSIIIPVYNRPQEIDELLQSITAQEGVKNFEVLVIEDGSDKKSDEIVEKYHSELQIHYFFKKNSGAGASRNFGMEKATGNYFIILDSDVVLPKHYLKEVQNALLANYTAAFGGPDAAHNSFTDLQKAINYSMTSILTTGGIRGKKQAVGKFQPRSFNLGISKKAFQITKGFSKMKNGEDIDLTFRLWQNGFQTQLIPKAFVYHKRRSSVKEFLEQTYGFGTARPILNRKYPTTAKITYWFPSFFIFGLFCALCVFFFGYYQFLLLYGLYFLTIFFNSLFHNKHFKVAFLSIVTVCVQFLGYGFGFIQSQFFLKQE